MATYTQVQAKIVTALEGTVGLTAAPSPGGLLGAGESAFDGRYDFGNATPRPTSTMQCGAIVEGEITFDVRIGHRAKGAAKDWWKQLQAQHVERCQLTYQTLLNYPVYVDNAVGIFSAGDARLEFNDDKIPQTAYSVIPFRVRWRDQ